MLNSAETIMDLLIKAGLVAVFAVSTGCVSVPMQTGEKSSEAKEFSAPEEGYSGLYLYRASTFGATIKEDIWVNGKCIGKTAPYMFFYETVESGREYKISTESEFSPNVISINPESGKNYFIKQYLRPGVFSAGAGLKLVSGEKGEKEVSKLELAQAGSCS